MQNLRSFSTTVALCLAITACGSKDTTETADKAPIEQPKELTSSKFEAPKFAHVKKVRYAFPPLTGSQRIDLGPGMGIIVNRMSYEAGTLSVLSSVCANEILIIKANSLEGRPSAKISSKNIFVVVEDLSQFTGTIACEGTEGDHCTLISKTPTDKLQLKTSGSVTYELVTDDAQEEASFAKFEREENEAKEREIAAKAKPFVDEIKNKVNYEEEILRETEPYLLASIQRDFGAEQYNMTDGRTYIGEVANGKMEGRGATVQKDGTYFSALRVKGQ